MGQVPVRGTSYKNSRGTTVNRRPSTRRVDLRPVKQGTVQLTASGLTFITAIVELASGVVNAATMLITVLIGVLLLLVGVNRRSPLMPKIFRAGRRTRARVQRRRAAKKANTPQRTVRHNASTPTRYQRKQQKSNWLF